ncbi:MAG: uncharacterized SAM-binding protein YcdF (DUF218 family) [Granulosicoccus sp.]|jgi:uncharacterized SAM-binding protein YcdF (DUF218 family)
MTFFRIVLLILLTITAFSISPAQAKKKPRVVYDAIIVPGYPFTPNGKMNMIYKMRLHWAVELYNTGVAKNIIVSGSAVHTPYVESKIYALYLIEMGVDPQHIHIEDRAEHSLENVYYGMELAKKHGFESVAVATDLFQSGMLQILGKKHKLEVDYLPANIGFIISKRWNSFTGEIDYQIAFVEGFVPLKEREDKKTRLEGTRGRIFENPEALTLN